MCVCAGWCGCVCVVVNLSVCVGSFFAVYGVFLIRFNFCVLFYL